MFRIEEKDYDLNFLLRFDMLKEVLMKLLKNQNNLQNEIDILRNTNIERDNKILNLEQIISEIQEKSSFEESGSESEQNNEITSEQIKENKIEEKELNKVNNNINDNKNENIEQDKETETEKEKNDDINNNEEIKDNAIKKEEKTEEKKEEEKREEKEEEKKEQIIKQEIKSPEKEKTDREKNDSKNNNEPLEKKKMNTKEKLVYSIKKNRFSVDMGQIPINTKELVSRINLLEIKLNNIINNKEIQNIKKELKNHDLENQSDFKVIDMKINDINQKLGEYNKKIEDCELKCASLDILNMIQDSGDGSVDGAKILFKSLDDKYTKKLEIIEARYKQEALSIEKMKKNVENVVPMFDKINRDIAHVKELEEQQKEEIENTKKNMETQNEQSNKLQKESDEIFQNKLNDLEKNLDKKLEEVEKRLKSIKKTEGEPLFNLHYEDNETNKMNEERFQIIEKKINDMRTKINDLNNTLRIYSNEETQKIKNDVKELIYKMDSKIEREDLKELYNMHLSDLDDINDLKDQISLINEEQKKTSKDLLQTSSRVEMLNSNVIMLQNSQLNGGRGPIIDVSKFIDQQKLSDTLKPLVKEIEKLYKEFSSVQREMSDMRNYEKIFEKKEKINKLEEEIYSKIVAMENFNNKKYADKIDTNRSLRALEIQIKDIIGERRKAEGGDSWLMAKQPLKCFNCASCEANLKNNGINQDYIPWNKYPQGERIYRMGQGFSHMLQMMTSEFVQTFEHNEKDTKDNNNINLSIENDYPSFNNKSVNKAFNSINNNNNTLNQNEKSLIGARINNKEDFNRTGKFKLPKMKKFTKYSKDKYDENIPVTDEEKDNVAISMDKTNFNSEQPKIMKIVKKKSKNPFNTGAFTPNNGGFSIDYGRKSFLKDKFELNLKEKILKKTDN